MKKYDYLIVGAGFAGSVMAERLAAKYRKSILIVEKRGHIGGNAYDEYDEHGILVHRYGPHIFHTNSKKVFDYLSRFTGWRVYRHKVLADYGGELFPIPINRITINKLYNLDFNTDEQVEKYFERVREKRNPVLNSEDLVVNHVGVDLFKKFYEVYTRKQWSMEARELAPSVCGRIPVRYNEDCHYFSDKYQGIPKDGYSRMFGRMLADPRIEIMLNTDYKSILGNLHYNRLIYTGPIDYYFDYKFGKLPYRSIKFCFENFPVEFYQTVAQINHVNGSPFTRVVEYKHITGQKSANTTISREYPQKEGEPFYPIPTEKNLKTYSLYKAQAEKETNTIFCGRLAEYRYYNMDQVIAKCLLLCSRIEH